MRKFHLTLSTSNFWTY